MLSTEKKNSLAQWYIGSNYAINSDSRTLRNSTNSNAWHHYRHCERHHKSLNFNNLLYVTLASGFCLSISHPIIFKVELRHTKWQGIGGYVENDDRSGTIASHDRPE